MTDAVKNLAYRLWEDAGCPDGRDQDFWLQAEAQLAMPAKAPKAAAKKAPAKRAPAKKPAKASA